MDFETCTTTSPVEGERKELSLSDPFLPKLALNQHWERLQHLFGFMWPWPKPGENDDHCS